MNETNVFSCYFQNSMNLPPDKARLLRQYDNEKKWDLICDQVNPPALRIRTTAQPAAPKQPTTANSRHTSVLCVFRRGSR